MIQEKEDLRLERPVDEVWTRTFELLSAQLPAPTIETWIRPLHLVALDGDEATIAVHNEFTRNWITNNHLGAIGGAISRVVNRKVTARVIVDETLEEEVYTPSIASITVIPAAAPGFGQPPATSRPAPAAQSRPPASNLNPKYSFDSFVVGSHNRFCHSAAMAVADRPGHAYNPLFIYGGVGLGKTHIMQAIGQHILKHSQNLQVRYISCERFTNELINSIRDDRMVEFRKRYRQVDVLLMDDIQFIQGKESTQEEFFHTFNALAENGRQVVLSSDRPPQALSKLEERLRSRFAAGLIADIQAPDLETRMAILRKKAQLENMVIPDEVMEYIASVFTSNIREMDGALIRTHAYASLTGAPLSVQSIAHILQPGAASRPKQTLTVDTIIETVAGHYRVEPSELLSAKRSKDLALPRHVAMYLAHELIQLSFPRIGDAFGKRKHTSALYACEKIKEAVAADADLSSAVSRIRQQLGF